MVKAGDVVKVRVVEVDVPRKRIGLTMRKDAEGARDQLRERGPGKEKEHGRGPSQASPKGTPSGGNAFADALRGKFGR